MPRLFLAALHPAEPNVAEVLDPLEIRHRHTAGVYEEIVVIAECQMQFGGGGGGGGNGGGNGNGGGGNGGGGGGSQAAEFHDSVLITLDTSATSIKANSGLTLGEQDDCDAGGGSIIVTYGGVNVASKLEMHGSQIIAAGDVDFAANANGIRGASIVAGGRIDGTSNMNFAFCGAGMEHVFLAEYFRLVN